MHAWFRFGRNTRYFQSCGRIDKGSVGQKYPVFLPKRNQECRIALSCDKVILGEVFIGSGSSYLTFSKITNFVHAATTEFKFYVIMKWATLYQHVTTQGRFASLISCLKRNRKFLADWTLCLPATGSQTWNFSSNVRSIIQNDNWLWTANTSADFDHFKVMISRVLRDSPNIDDAKEI